MSETTLEKAPQGEAYNPQDYLLLVAFGGQLEPKINREFMANGIPVQRVAPERGTNEVDLSELDLTRCRGMVFSGGDDSVFADNARRIPQALLDLEVPKLGICYGEQALAYQLGGEVQAGTNGEYGVTRITLEPSPLFEGIKETELGAMMSHKDVVSKLPPGCRALAMSPEGIAGFSNDKDIYAVQFHPESSDTDYGTQLLLNFATKVCGIQPEPEFTPDKYRQRVAEQQTSIAQHNLGRTATRAIILDSGGVDSAVAHALTHQALSAIGKDSALSGIYVDSGLMRHEDGDTIRLMNQHGYPVEMQDWSDFFLHQSVPLPPSVARELGYAHLPPMDQVTDPRIMRRIVKYGFLEVQRRIGAGLRERYPDAEVIALVQGTNLADKIESGDFSGDQIKEHHNSGVEPFVDWLFEPLASLFKGDIRLIAHSLGLPEEIIFRQPFPGPGLCLRILANRTGEPIWPADIDNKRRELEKLCKAVGGGALSGCWLPVEATGQKGDERVHGYMTLLSGPYDPQLIEKLAYDIPARTGATRVLFTEREVDPDRVAAVPQMVDEKSLNPLRDAEEAKRQAVIRTGLGSELSQHYTASLPVTLSGEQNTTLMLRMFRTGVRSGLEDYITGEAALGGLNVDEKNFHELRQAVEEVATQLGYDQAVYEVTSKPPATVELV